MNNTLTQYVSRRPDPDAFAIDDFSMTWCHDYFFMFSTFSLVSRTLQKVEEGEATAVLIAPIGQHRVGAQPLSIDLGKCYRLPKTYEILSLPNEPEKIILCGN